jgi:hypothetical protein
MGRRWSTSTITDVPVVTTNETVAMVSDSVSQSIDGERVSVDGRVGLLTGTNTTAVTVRVREGNGITGTIIGETLPYTIGAAVDVQIPYGFTYNPASIAGMVYSVTVQQTAASANGTVKSVSMAVALGQ